MSELVPQRGHLPFPLVAVTGAFALAGAITSTVSIYMHAKNYRKPLLQRFVVRIQFLIPIYALSCWLGLVSHQLAIFIDPIRDLYEAFVIYQFLWLLANFLGGERNLIVTMYGQPPREHIFPFRKIFPKVDISDPHTFLAIKRGVLQYAWLKPILAVAAFLMKAIGIYQEGYISITSGYLWLGLIYNASVSTALYSLALFWMCLAKPLKPFRPVPKFLCIKLILFASYWQGFVLSLLVLIGFIKDVGYYTPNNVARVVQNSLMCVELFFFAIAHWYAFSWKDYVDNSIGSARMPVYYAFRDAFGMGDVVEDFKDTLRGEQYQYRLFDSVGAIEHPESAARFARLREGLRYQRGGEAKYWLPRPSNRRSITISELLRSGISEIAGSSSGGYMTIPQDDSNECQHLSVSPYADDEQGTVAMREEWVLDKETEDLFSVAKAMEYGDYNYPVVTINESLTYTPLIKKLTPDHIIDPTPYSWIRPSSAAGSSRPSQERPLARSTSTPNLLLDLEDAVELDGANLWGNNTGNCAPGSQNSTYIAR
ncbi:organic solute transporter Ostalpha-domain-containing protein [Lipomyces kononenkoae]|uniref:Organic solute transporter Ostalpha-domain-containing protein n=1 Tax=Lipomyces kononenkoae TaxID=34357 RepID=A0ACC3SY65_LIPKO